MPGHGAGKWQASACVALGWQNQSRQARPRGQIHPSPWAICMKDSKVNASAPKRGAAKRLPESPPGGRSRERREQQRSVETRIAILDAALQEFAENGYDAASTRNIGRRAGIHNTLLTYHFRNKESLWKATAEHFFSEIADQLSQTAAYDPALSPIEKLREEFRSFFSFTNSHPAFHQFMIREGRPNNPRLAWLMENFLKDIIARNVPLIEQAQKSGDLPAGNPVLLYYFLVGVLTVLSAQSAEIKFHSHVDPMSSDFVGRYWNLVDRLVFARARSARRPG